MKVYVASVGSNGLVVPVRWVQMYQDGRDPPGGYFSYANVKLQDKSAYGKLFRDKIQQFCTAQSISACGIQVYPH